MRLSGQAADVQRLEPRTLCSVSLSFETLVNASKNPFNQSETAIAINRTNPNNVFLGSNHGSFVVADQGPNDPISESGIFTSYTRDGGATWTTKVMALDEDGDDVSDDYPTTPGAGPIGHVGITDSGGGSTTNPDIGALATNAAGVTYALNFGPGNRIQIVSLAIPATPGAPAAVAGTTVAEVYAQALAAGGAALNGAIRAVNAADFNPIDGRLYFSVSGAPPAGLGTGADLLFSVDVNPALSRAQREASVALVGNFGPAADLDATVTSFTFDLVPTGVKLVGLLSTSQIFQPPTNPPAPPPPPITYSTAALFNVDLSNVRIVNAVSLAPEYTTVLGNGLFGGIQVDRDTPDGLNDVIALMGDDPLTTDVVDPRVFRIGTDASAIDLGPLGAAVANTTGVNPTGLTFNPTVIDPFTLRPGAFIGVDGTTDEVFFVDTRDRVFPVACCDPSVTYDTFGNLYFAYLALNANGQTAVAILTSSDGGQTFYQIGEILGDFPAQSTAVDRCEVTAAPQADGSNLIVVSFVDFSITGDSISAAVTNSFGLGGPWGGTERGSGGVFAPPQKMPQGGTGTGAPLAHNLAHPSIGPDGQISVAHQEVGINNPGDRVFVNTDPDGLGPAPFGNAVYIDTTQLTGKEPLPGQPLRGAAAVATLAYDRSNGPHRGRLYIAYAQNTTRQRVDPATGIATGVTTDSDILLRFSDDNGASWSPATRVNDDPVSSMASQFFQRVAVDPVTGNVAVGWLDTRDDPGNGNPADEVGYYLTVGQAQGNDMVFAPNIRLNVGLSNAAFSGNFGNDYGDYTGLDFYNGLIWAAYPDNTNSTGDNPSGKLRAFDDYAAAVRVTDTTVPIPPFVTAGSPLSPTVSKPQSLVKKGKFYQLKVSYTHPSGVNLATVGNDDVIVSGPNGFSQPMTLLKAKAKKKGTVVEATYRLAAPGGKWDAADNGVYTAILQANSVASNDNSTTTQAGTLTNFLVNAKPAKTKGGKAKSEPASAAVVAVPPSTFGDASVLSARKDTESLLA